MANENNEVLKKYNEFWDGIKNEIETINGGKTSKRSSAEYDKDFMKIKFNSDDNLPLNKTLKLHNMTTVIRSVFEEHGINFILNFIRYDRINISDRIDINKTNASKDCKRYWF